jgi:FkbM family methyltransferase
VAVDVSRGAARHTLWLPAGDVWVVHQVFEQGEYAGVRPGWLAAPPVVLDVGAHCGTFALYAKLALHPRAVVHCFEPYPPHVALLRRNTARWGGVTVHPVGLGAADGTATLYLDPRTDTAHSTLPGRVPRPAGREPVPVRDAAAALDGLGLTGVDVLKLDAEGAEADILDRLGPRLARVRVVLAEYHSPADRERFARALPGHRLFAEVSHSPRVGVAKYVRADLAG